METISTVPTEALEQLTEVVDYTPLLEEIAGYVAVCADASVYVTSFLLFGAVVLLCYFGYRFLRIFF